MPDENEVEESGSIRDWRIWFGIVITILWIAGGTWYVIDAYRAAPEAGFPLDVIGGFLEGAFAPLAFLWLVIGLVIQQGELARNSAALRRTSEQSEKQTLAIAATEMNARQETYFKMKQDVFHHLGNVSGMLYASSMGPTGIGEMDRAQMDDAFRAVAAGDHEIFARLFLMLQMLEDEDLTDLFFGTEIRRTHAATFMQSFERLRSMARNCDVDGIIEDSLMQSGFGLLYRKMRSAAPDDAGGRF
jgi:hypothetical protein